MFNFIQLYLYTHTYLCIIYIYTFIVIYLLGHNVKCVSSWVSGSEKVRLPVLQHAPYLQIFGCFCSHSSSPFPDDSNHERVRQSICCTAPHKSFPPDLIFPGCSSLLIHFPWAQSQATRRIQTLVWAPVPTQRQRRGWANRPTAELTLILWLVNSGPPHLYRTKTCRNIPGKD